MTEQTTQIEHLPATDEWKQWEGRAVNGEFRLHRYLGGSGHSAVFLTNYGESGGQPAAIKLVPDDPAKAEHQLASWKLAAGLSHPNLLRVFQWGRCQVDSVQLLYVVTELAEEDLSQILPQRALAPSEAREMLRPALDALAYLHALGLVHGHIKPANIMASGDQVKLSCDGLCHAGEPTRAPNDPAIQDSYSAPERKHSPASDAWSLGMTLVEALTQRLPEWERSAAEAEPIVPDTLAEPFLQIARRCLRRNPALRLKAADISSRLEPLPVQELPEIAPAAETPARSHNLVWVVAIALLLAAIVTTSVRLKRHHHGRQAASHAIEKPKPQTNAKHVEQPAIEKPPAPASINRQAAEKTNLRAPIQPVAEKKIAVPSAVQEEAIHQVLPDVPQKAKDTIHGTVRVRVKVSVDPSGRVTEAALDFPGPSRYFANLALQAARQWTFGRAGTANPNTPRAWTLHFEFSPTETRARPEKAGQ